MHPRDIQARKPIQYRKPTRINNVSIGLLLLLGLIAYLAASFYPNITLAGNVKDVMRSELLKLYQINLQTQPQKSHRLQDFERRVRKTIADLGIKDPNYRFTVQANEKTVSMEAHYTSTVHFLWLNKTTTWVHNPKVETSAERIDW